MQNITNPIAAGQTLKARSACDSECIFTAEVIERKGDMLTLRVNGAKDLVRKKVVKDYTGAEVVYAMGKYSMAPIFSNK